MERSRARTTRRSTASSRASLASKAVSRSIKIACPLLISASRCHVWYSSFLTQRCIHPLTSIQRLVRHPFYGPRREWWTGRELFLPSAPHCSLIVVQMTMPGDEFFASFSR